MASQQYRRQQEEPTPSTSPRPSTVSGPARGPAVRDKTLRLRTTAPPPTASQGKCKGRQPRPGGCAPENCVVLLVPFPPPVSRRSPRFYAPRPSCLQAYLFASFRRRYRRTYTAVMLSPELSSTSAMRASWSMARWGEVLASFFSSCLKASSGLITSHSPSQASSSSSPSCTRTTRTSGLGTTSESVKGRPASLVSSQRLKSRSPMARETARARMTRPPATHPPAWLIRAVSSGRCPFASIATTAVEPAVCDVCLRKASSVATKASCTTSLRSPSPNGKASSPPSYEGVTSFAPARPPPIAAPTAVFTSCAPSLPPAAIWARRLAKSLRCSVMPTSVAVFKVFSRTPLLDVDSPVSRAASFAAMHEWSFCLQNSDASPPPCPS
eukprot:scaffold45929_cov26-Tisochrysis_lutea.AAC.2